ncbi:MAG TPA: SPOR domain-containing protein [Blastocatellia bacterium]|nr:SPOR domain-containing protein [Blastocatellia bacterium]
MAMSNKQVIAIFILGIALLLGAFWAGLNVVKQGSAADSARPAETAPAKKQQAVPVPADATASNESRYVVFVAAFGTLEPAKKLEAELRQKNYLAAHVKMPAAQDTLYRVNIGPYDRRDADKVAAELATEGRKGIMILPWTQN